MADQIILQDIQIAREMTISIWPREWVQWEGSAAQLVDERLVSANIEWPKRRNSLYWNKDGMSYWLKRTRPPNIKGPMSVWANGDWWVLRSTLTTDTGRGSLAADIYAKSVELIELQFQRTVAGRQMVHRAHLARTDDTYIAFRSQLLGKIF